MPTVKTSFKTRGTMYAAGTDVPKSDPVCKSHAAFFEESPVEQATAGPGEKRSTRRPAKKTASKPKAEG